MSRIRLPLLPAAPVPIARRTARAVQAAATYRGDTDYVLFGGATMDDDILSQGDDRERRRWPRAPWVIAAVVLAVIAGGVYLALPRHQHAASAAPTVTASASVFPSLPWGDSLRLPVAGTQPAWFWPATGRSEPIGGLPAESAGYQFSRVDGGWAVQADSAAKIGCDDCAGIAMPVWFLADSARSAARVGTASLVAPAASTDAMWLTSYRPGADDTTAVGQAREVGPTGALLRPAVTLPAGFMIERGTDRGLMLEPTDPVQGPGFARLWNPGSQHASRTFDPVIAASATEIAWVPPCALTCSVTVLDLATGRNTVVRLPPGDAPSSAAFSPSGGFLALQLSPENTGDGGALAVRLEVASVASGRLTLVPGTVASSDALADFGWPADSDSLVAEFNFDTSTQLTSWHPGVSGLALAVVKPGRTQASLIVG